MKNIKHIFLLSLVSLAVTSCDIKDEPFIQGAEDEKAILEFAIDSVQGVIDEAAKTVELALPEGTDLTHLTPQIKVSKYATVEPASGVEQDFSNPLVYTVTAFNGTKVQYLVTAIAENPENEKRILSFAIETPAVHGIIDEVVKTVTLSFDQGTDVTNLKPIIEVSENATVIPESGVNQDFTNPVTYTVKAANGTTAEYVVTAVFEVPFTPEKRVLLEDYTGVRCVNCPAAAEVVAQLKDLYGDKLVVMGIHGGNVMTQPLNPDIDFRTPEGNEWWNYFGFSFKPIGMVDRKGAPNYPLNSGEWATEVATELEKDPVVALRITNAYNAASRTLNVAVSGKMLADNGNPLKLVVSLMENDIVGPQITPSGLNPDYVHKHVFRGTLDRQAWGQSIGDAPFAAGSMFEKNYSYTLPDNFVADNCSVVAYVYQDNDKAVLQVEERHVMP